MSRRGDYLYQRKDGLWEARFVKEIKPFLTSEYIFSINRSEIKDHLNIKEGDILISRSGTIGKVTYATKDLAENYLVSDDLVRVRVENDDLRAYLLAYFMSSTALSLMLRDEYGSVQQHLQPRHIQEMIIPIPESWNMATEIIEAGRKLIDAMEQLSIADNALRKTGFDSL